MVHGCSSPYPSPRTPPPSNYSWTACRRYSTSAPPTFFAVTHSAARLSRSIESQPATNPNEKVPAEAGPSMMSEDVRPRCPMNRHGFFCRSYAGCGSRLRAA